MVEPTTPAPDQNEPAAITPGALAKKFAYPVVFVVCLAVAASLLIDVRHFGQLLLQARLWPLAALLVFHMLNLMLHTLRMHVLLRRALPLREVFHANNICNMVNSILPLRAGEVTMALLLGHRMPGGGAEVLSTIFVDRLLGLISILTIFLAVLPGFSPNGAAAVTLAGSSIYYVVAFGGIILGMLLVTALEDPLVSLARLVLSRLPLPVERTVERLRACINGLRVLFHLRTSLPVFLLAIATWGCVIALNYFGVLSVIESTSVTAAVFVTFLTIVGVLLVPTPSGVGTAHAAIVLSLSMFGVGTEQALASAILIHALVSFANIGLGMLSAHRMNFRLSRLLGPSRGRGPAARG